MPFEFYSFGVTGQLFFVVKKTKKTSSSILLV